MEVEKEKSKLIPVVLSLRIQNGTYSSIFMKPRLHFYYIFSVKLSQLILLTMGLLIR